MVTALAARWLLTAAALRACQRGATPRGSCSLCIVFSIIRYLGFGEVLRGHRRAARLTLEQLAEVSGVSARTLSDMERGRSKGPQHRTVTALADALALEGDARKQLVELARDGRLRDHWTRPAGLCELPRLVDDFTGRAAELVWMSELVYAESAPGAGVVGLITGSGGMGKTTLAIRAAHVLRPSFPGGVFFLDLLGMSPRPAAIADALRLLLRALGVADEQIPGDVPGRASVYRSLLRDRQSLVVLDNAGSEEQVRPLGRDQRSARAVSRQQRRTCSSDPALSRTTSDCLSRSSDRYTEARPGTSPGICSSATPSARSSSHNASAVAAGRGDMPSRSRKNTPSGSSAAGRGPPGWRAWSSPCPPSR